MKRQLDDYYDRFYQKQGKRTELLKANGCALAKEIAAWKEHVVEGWDAVEVKSISIPEALKGLPEVGETYHVSVTLDAKDLASDLGLDLVVMNASDGKSHEYRAKEMQITKTEGSVVTFEIDYKIKYSGAFKFGFRLFPKNENLPHRMDFAYTRWF